MRVLVTGRDGQLGRWLVRLVEADPDATLLAAIDLDDLDFGRPDEVASIFDAAPGERPDLVLNAAAFTAVDRCESEEALALRVNGETPGVIARRCREEGVGLVHVSTDFVFDGDAREPYVEDAHPAPRSAYGRTKLEGERRVLQELPTALVVRTSWVFGPGKNFVRTMVEQAEKRARGEVDSPLAVVSDQRGRPTYSADLARGILDLVDAGARGIVHLSNGGIATWWELARAALDAAGHSTVEIGEISASEYPRPAVTPMYSVLSLERARSLGVSLPPWREAVDAYLASEDSPVTKEAA